MSGPRKIAIIGGGPAGLSAAYHLTTEPGWESRYEVTVYQLGFRLGGKGATGRDLDRGARIEEHGIHGFCRFYFNTWATIAGVYEELGKAGVRELATPTLPEAFLPSSATLALGIINNGWTEKLSYHQNSDGVPWEDLSPDLGKARIIDGLLADLVRRGRHRKEMTAQDLSEFGDLVVPMPDQTKAETAAKNVHDYLKQAQSAFREVSAGDDGQPVDPNAPAVLKRSMEAAVAMLSDGEEKLLGLLARLASEGEQMPPDQVRALAVTDLLHAMFKGLHAARFWETSFDLDSLDHEDYRDWLKQHGATDQTLASGIAYGVANILFAYENGDSTRPPRLSAASWLNWMLRGFLGTGEYFYFLGAGTGDSVILPLYECLRARGVRFEFFHKLESAECVDEGGTSVIDRLVFQRQARTLSGQPYDPISEVEIHGKTHRVWPNQPRWEQLAHGETNRARGTDFEEWAPAQEPEGSSQRILRRGAKHGFDYVVWAIPPSMIPEVGDEEIEQTWAKTVEHLPTTATQAAQIWLNEDTTELGWNRKEMHPPDSARYACATFENPMNAFVAFDDLIKHEGWGEDGPKGLVYFCSQLHGIGGSRSDDLARVVQSTSAALRGIGTFMREARPPVDRRPDPRTIDFDLVYDPRPGGPHRGEERLAYQYFRANTQPTEAYVQAPPDNVKGRRFAWESGFGNLVVAGDWTYNGFNLGSFESAITGGRLAAFALCGCGKPDDIVGFGFLHPDAAEKLQRAVNENVIPIVRSA